MYSFRNGPGNIIKEGRQAGKKERISKWMVNKQDNLRDFNNKLRAEKVALL